MCKGSPTPEAVAETLGLDLESVANVASTERPLYSQFCEEVCSDAVVVWRKHTDWEDTVVMNDYCPSTGRLLPQKFVHVIATKGDAESPPAVYCSCKTYGLLQQAAKTREGRGELEDIVLDSTFTWMHCRFFRDRLQEIDIDSMESDEAIPNYMQSIHKNASSLGCPLVYLGAFAGVTKYSVAGSEGFSIVHVAVYQGECWAKCLSGSCQGSHYTNKKKIPKSEELTNVEVLCPHLKNLAENLDAIKEDVDFFSQDIGDIADADVPLNVEEQVEIEEKGLEFNISSGKWEAQAISENPCDNMRDPLLVKSTGVRLRYVRQDGLNDGLYQGPTLLPAVEQSNCTCETKLETIHYFNTKVYSREVFFKVPSMTFIFISIAAKQKTQNHIFFSGSSFL